MSDPAGDVSNAKGDGVTANFFGIGNLQLILNKWEDVTSKSWKTGATSIVLYTDVNGDKKADYTTTFRVVHPGLSPEADIVNAAGKLVCVDGVSWRAHEAQRDVGFGTYIGCYGFPKTWTAYAKFIRCDPTTGKTTTDRFPNSGWVGPNLGTDRQDSYYQVGSGIPTPTPACKKAK